MNTDDINTVLKDVCRRPERLMERRTFVKCLGMGFLTLAVPAGGSLSAVQGESVARFYDRLDNGTVRCHQCFRHCMIEPGEAGQCRIRINQKGTLTTQSYGNPGAVNIDPVEKKPFSHVLPGSLTYSIGLIGCNIDCKFCQNWQIAHAKIGSLRVQPMTPDQIVVNAKAHACRTIACTYSEPTVWSEYVLDCAQAGLKAGIPTLVVSNGTWSEVVLDEVLKCVKAIKVDLKSIEPDYYRTVCRGELAPVLKNIERIRRAGVWLELVNLLVPSLNDTPQELKKMAQWIKTNLGDDIPLHFSRFHPMYKLQNLSPTPEETLTRAWETAKGEGLKFVYVGNVASHPGENTVCPGCGQILIRRRGFRSELHGFNDGRCGACGVQIPGIWSLNS